MTTSTQLRDLAVNALKGATDAGQNVYTIRTWPTEASNYPIIMVKAPKEHKESLGRNAPQFNTTLTLGILARVKAAAQLKDAGALAAEQAIERLKNQIEVALINNPSLMDEIQQFASVDTEVDVNSEGDDINGQLVMTLAIEFYQGPEDFYPVVGTPATSNPYAPLVVPALPGLTEVNITETNLPPVGIDITLPQ